MRKNPWKKYSFATVMNYSREALDCIIFHTDTTLVPVFHKKRLRWANIILRKVPMVVPKMEQPFTITRYKH